MEIFIALFAVIMAVGFGYYFNRYTASDPRNRHRTEYQNAGAGRWNDRWSPHSQ